MASHKPATRSVSFAYTGAEQSWTVPAGITSITVTVKGAQGGGAGTNIGGTGASITTTLSVTPSTNLKVVVGAQGGAGVNQGTSVTTCPYGGGGTGGYTTGAGSGYYSGGAGGGYSGLFVNAVSAGNTMIIAAGGGGAAYGSQRVNGGAAGTSGNGSDGSGTYSTYHCAGYGATTTANGAAGVPYDAQGVNPTVGQQLIGGNGGSVGSAQGMWAGGGGGGAGYYSGGGGASGGGAMGSGGGGSSRVVSGTNTSYSSNTGNGSVSITY